jgi:CopG family transcriptional regulator / antitoxin EndoAI
MKNNMYRRVNITLPSQTLQRIDHIANHGTRSRFIDTAVNFYLGQRKRAQLHNDLREGAIARAARDRGIAIELFDFTNSWETQQA